MDKITPENSSLWIVSYKRQEALLNTVRTWCESFPFETVNILSNYQQDFSFCDEYPIKVWPNIFRQDWLTGSLAWCWNQAMLHTFEFKDWCVMSQDDVSIIPGWDSLVTGQYDTYIAPHGDVIQIQSIEGFNKIGWFDERFRAIGGCEADYLLRCLRSNSEGLSAHDEHIWQLRHNDVGLANYFINSVKQGEILQTRMEHNLEFAQVECFNRWNDKWGESVDHLFLSKNYNRNRNWKEIDWYPAFTRRLIGLGRTKEFNYAELY